MAITSKALQSNYKKDSVFFYLNKAYDKAIETNNKEHKFFTLNLLVKKSNESFDLESMKLYADKYAKEIEKETDSTIKPHYINLKYTNYLAYFLNLGALEQSLTYVDSLSNRVALTPVSERGFFDFEDEHSANAYRIMILRARGEYDKAVQLLNIYLIENAKDERNNEKRQILFKSKYLRELALIYNELGYYDKAILTGKQVLDISKTWQSDFGKRASEKINLSDSYIKAGRLIEATKILDKSLDNVNYSPMLKLHYIKAQINLAVAKKEYNNAIDLSNGLIESMIALRKDSLHQDVTERQIMKAQVFERLNQTEEAYLLYSKIYKDLTEDPVIRDQYFKKRLKIAAIYGVLKTTKNSNNTLNEKEIINLITQLIVAVDQLQMLYSTTQDKQFLIEKTYPALQLALDMVFNFYKNKNDPELVALAFLISEKSKSIALRESQKNTSKEHIKGVPDSIIRQEKILRSTVQHYSNKVGEDYTNREFSDSLYVYLERFSNFQKTLENNYSKYYNFKYSNRVLTLAEVQDKMAKDRIVLSYFKSETALYGISIEKDKQYFKRIEWSEEYDKMVKTFTSRVAENNFDTAIANQLHAKLIQPLILNKRTSRLLIIPDGVLNYLNFELLQEQKKWMLYSTAISYDESVTLSFASNAMNPNYITDFVGFAPFYAKSDSLTERATLTPLFYSKQEIKTIANYYDGDYYTGEEGSLARFRESVTNKKSKTNKIYHIASHAKVNEKEPEKSYILFNNGDSEKLLAQDIFTLDMQDSFVVLSACETGTGMLKTGQGMRSFSQAFRYAGATALLHSKWKVSDRSTALIMEQFYANLTQGLTKDIALQKAKINYINTVEDKTLATPYYWAAFVITGDVETVPLNSFSFWKLGVFILLVVLSLALIYFLRQKYTKSTFK